MPMMSAEFVQFRCMYYWNSFSEYVPAPIQREAVLFHLGIIDTTVIGRFGRNIMNGGLRTHGRLLLAFQDILESIDELETTIPDWLPECFHPHVKEWLLHPILSVLYWKWWPWVDHFCILLGTLGHKQVKVHLFTCSWNICERGHDACNFIDAIRRIQIRHIHSLGFPITNIFFVRQRPCRCRSW